MVGQKNSMNFSRILQILSFCILFSLLPFISFSQLSPGPLSKYHEHLEGLSNCTQCHDLGKAVSDSKCLDCHKEIKSRIDADKGYHSSEEVKGKACASCHSDHHGKNFQIVRFDTTSFDHDLAGYPLKGQHAKNSCASCHKGEFIEDTEIKEKDFSSFLGLNETCLTCHEDYHQNTLSTSCNECHSFEDFKPADYFDHDKTDFPLVGAHKKQECVECHELTSRNGKDFQVFSDVAHTSCTDCHEDVHNNKFGQNCTKCHTQTSFKTLKSTNAFDHDKTDYPLVGKHVNVDCKECHKASYTTALKFSACMDCHDDYHKGEILKNNQVRECEDCHTVQGFENSSYSIDEHQLSQYPLDGAHLATPCFSCHLKEDQWRFKEIGRNCKDCHDDVHEGSIPSELMPDQNCKTCHATETWHSVNFEHTNTGYELEGKHSTTSCSECHFKVNPPKVYLFHDTDTDCKACHEDNHNGQFDYYGEESCAKCHTMSNWDPDLFDHTNTKFPLEGKHSEVDCNECHKPYPNMNKEVIEYKIKNYKCEDCHGS